MPIADVIPIEMLQAARRYQEENDYHIKICNISKEHKYSLHGALDIVIAEIVGDDEIKRELWNQVCLDGDYRRLEKYLNTIPGCVMGVEGGCTVCDHLRELEQEEFFDFRESDDGECQVHQFPLKRSG